MQAPWVTMTLAVAAKSSPPDMRATTVMICVDARRMWSARRACPARGPRWKRATLAIGFFSEKDEDRLHVIGCRHRAFDLDAQRHHVAVLRELRHAHLDAALVEPEIGAERVLHGRREVVRVSERDVRCNRKQGGAMPPARTPRRLGVEILGSFWHRHGFLHAA